MIVKRNFLQDIFWLILLLIITPFSNAQIKSNTSKNKVARKITFKKNQIKFCTINSSSHSIIKTSSDQVANNPTIIQERSINSVFAVLKQSDRDCDGISDYDDNCVDAANSKQIDRNNNGIGDACEPTKYRKVIKRR